MKQRKEAGVFGATVAVAAVVTAGFPWQNVLLGWAIGTGIMLLVQNCSGGTGGKLPALVTVLGGVVILAAAAMGAEDAFPEDSTFPFVSLALMLLTLRSICGEKNNGATVANLIGMILLPLLVLTVLFGLRDVRWTDNAPVGLDWMQVWIAAAATAPWWSFRRGRLDRKGWFWYGAAGALAVGMSLLTRGILGAALCDYEEFPLYRAVQTIRILGTLQRLEALLAAVVLMGAFGVMLLTAQHVRGALDVLLPGERALWKNGVVLAAAFALEWTTRALQQNLGEEIGAVFWGVVPVLALWVVFTEKVQKFVEKA